MNRHLLRVLLALYPRAWRDRYGADLAGLTEDLINAGEIRPLSAVVNLAGGAALEWGRVLAGSRYVVGASGQYAGIRIRGSWSTLCPTLVPESDVIAPVREKAVRGSVLDQGTGAVGDVGLVVGSRER